MLFAMTPQQGGLYGSHPSFSSLDDGDLQHTVDFRSVYATLLKWLQIPGEPVLGSGFNSLDFA